MSRAVLMIAYHFPPAAMGSGHLRTLGFARYLPATGWDPIVLSALPLAYARTAPVHDGVIPEGCRVHRSLALDVQRHLGIRGRYPGFLAQPDRWASWWPAAVLQGMRLIRRHHVQAIWSTYPIMTAHHVAHTLSALTGLPWVADFRDPVASSVEAENPFSVASQQRWEKRVMQRAAKVVFTTPGARRACAENYPEAASGERLAVIQNGYDEADFASVQAQDARRAAPFELLHSGLLYPEGRDPSAFFMALARLKRAGKAGPALFRVVLRASGCEARYQQQIDQLGIADMVTLAPPIGNREALQEQSSADALLLFQGSHFDRQIPAKLYEYLRVGKPIFALAGRDGDTAALLREVDGSSVVAIDNADEIGQGLARLVDSLANGKAQTGGRPGVEKWSRRHRTVELAQLLDQVTGRNAG